MDETAAAVAEIVAELTNLTGSGSLDPDAELVELGLSSMQLVRLVTRIESQFSITFPSDAMNAETFASVASTAAAVDAIRHRAQG
ncbi:acyl carrier protein [Saccharopolyspora sp. SCSIO 74807]|uniref:acyl carrier protein n=1 Tax=Saccharopolyspora sp. SCSIO 74807 TaxID=3118084 RepID=UPI0030CB9AB8